MLLSNTLISNTVPTSMNKLALGDIDIDDRGAYIKSFSSMELLVRKLTGQPWTEILDATNTWMYPQSNIIYTIPHCRF